jgi:hypothetical protein
MEPTIEFRSVGPASVRRRRSRRCDLVRGEDGLHDLVDAPPGRRVVPDPLTTMENAIGAARPGRNT